MKFLNNMKVLMIILFPFFLYAECNLFIHHVEYGEYGRSCHSISENYADSIYKGFERKRSSQKWYKHYIPDSICQELINENLGTEIDSSFCPRIMGMVRFNDNNFFIHRFSYFYSGEKKFFPIKSVPRLKDYLMTFEYFRRNYREMRNVSPNSRNK